MFLLVDPQGGAVPGADDEFVGAGCFGNQGAFPTNRETLIGKLLRLRVIGDSLAKVELDPRINPFESISQKIVGSSNPLSILTK